MATVIVPDSGILLSTFLNEPLTPNAKAILKYWETQSVQLVAPTLFRYEVVAVIRKALFQQRITLQEAISALNFSFNYSIQYRINENYLKRAFELANQFNQPTAYDAQYLALAEDLGADFWTSDERFYNTIKSKLNWVYWIGNFSLQ